MDEGDDVFKLDVTSAAPSNQVRAQPVVRSFIGKRDMSETKRLPMGVQGEQEMVLSCVDFDKLQGNSASSNPTISPVPDYKE